MKRSTYYLGIFFLTASVITGVYESILHLMVGPMLSYQQSFAHWHLVVSIFGLIGLLYVLRYFQFKKYRIAFVIGAICATIGLVQTIFLYTMLLQAARHLGGSYIIIVFLSLGSNFVLGISLVFSNARKQSWLKAAGVILSFLSVLVAGSVVGAMSFPAIDMQLMFLNISHWLSLILALVPLIFISIFWKEVNLIDSETPSSNLESFFRTISLMAGMLTAVVAFVFGISLGKESYWTVHWEKRGPEEAQKLAAPFEKRKYTNLKGDTLLYLFMKPLDYDSTNKYPLVVCLHGGPTLRPGVVVTEPAPLLSKQENKKAYPAFLFVPQGPPGILWGGIPGVPGIDSLVFDAIQALEAEFKVDDKRRYVAGISGGGYGSWHFITSRPEMFAAAIPICGAGNPELASRVVNIPIWAFHGTDDRNVPVSGSRMMIEAIRNAGGNPRYSEFTDTGHNVWPKVNETPGVLDWLFAQKRD